MCTFATFEARAAQKQHPISTSDKSVCFRIIQRNIWGFDSQTVAGPLHSIRVYHKSIITPHACARGKVIGRVVVVIVFLVVIVSTKIAISRDIGV